MRLIPLIATALVLSISAPSFAQEWIEYASREDRFTCNFPAQPIEGHQVQLTNNSDKSRTFAGIYLPENKR